MAVGALIHKLHKDLIIRRLKAVSGATGNQRRYNTTATIEGAFQELDQQSKTVLDLNTDRAWIVYVDIDYVDYIQAEDQVEIEGVLYKVIEKTKKDYGTNQHYELILVEYNG